MSAKGSELKRVRQSLKANLRNKHYKSFVKTALKQAFATTKKADAEKKAKTATSAVDKVWSKGVIHKNTAARFKSRLMKHVNSL